LPSQKLVIRLDPRAAPVPALRDRLEAYAATAALSALVAHRLGLVCEELAANIAMHGADGERGATFLEITVERVADTLRLAIEDDGRPFDPLGAPPPDTTLDIESRAIGGLGIHLVRSLVRSMAYERLEDRNRLSAVLDAAG
jgi:serine/threonine-protein kinase RsbW